MPPLLVSLTPLPAATWFSQEVSHSSTDQAQPCLASVGNQSWAVGWYGCSIIFCTYVSPFVLDFFCSVTLVLSHINCLKRWPWRQNVMSPPTINFTKQSQKSGKDAVRSQTIKGISISVKKKRSIQVVENKNLSQRQVSQIWIKNKRQTLKCDIEKWMIYRDAHLSPVYIMSQNHRPFALPLFTSYSLTITKSLFMFAM